MKNRMILWNICIMCLMIVSQVNAQENDAIVDKGNLKIVVKKQNNHIRKGSVIDSIDYYLTLGKITDVVLYYKNTDSVLQKFDFLDKPLQRYTKGFDLTFKGDSLIWEQQYSNLKLPEIPVVTRYTLDWKPDSNTFLEISRVQEYADSTIYRYTKGYHIKRDKTGGWGTHIRLIGDMGLLEKQLSDQLQDKNLQGVDSVLVYQVEVGRDRKFTINKLLYGSPSAFSQVVAKVLQEDAQWYPAIFSSSGGPIDLVRARIYVRLMQDGQVQIQIPQKLYNFTGD